MVLRFSPAAVAAAAALALSSFSTHAPLGVDAYTAKGMGGVASSAATHPSSALVPSSALARRGGGRYGDYDDLPYGPPRLNDMDDYGVGPYDYGACGRIAFCCVGRTALCVCVRNAATTATKEKEECNGEKWHMFVAKKEVNSSAVPRFCWFYNIEI